MTFHSKGYCDSSKIPPRKDLWGGIISFLDCVSNNETWIKENVNEEFIEQAGEEFKSAIRRQFTPVKKEFRLRASNVGKPLCMLKRERDGDKEERRSYNSVLRMLFGDAVEIIMAFIIKSSGSVNITDYKKKISLEIKDYIINGEDDIEIDNRIYDIKTCSDWAYRHIWSKGCSALKENDSFGYISQLVVYAKGRNKHPGGWIVINKSTGDISVVDANLSEKDIEDTLYKIEDTTKRLLSNEPFERCFSDQEEYVNRKLTNNRRINNICSFCSYMRKCWPNSCYRPQTNSKAISPRYHWYSEYEEQGKGEQQ